MGALDSLLKNPQLVNAAVSLLSKKKGSVGGSGGLDGLVSNMQKKGLGDVANSWVSTGANKPISPSQVTEVLGQDTVAEFSQKAGIGQAEGSAALASLLPALVNQVTPKGQVPQSAALESALGSLLGGLGR
jgi:uncharacterized protein YidB (DUF937 family)